MLMRSILSRLAKEKGHRVRVMGVLSAVEHIFNETAMHVRTQASNPLANKARHGPRVSPHTQARVRARVKSKGKSKGTKSANQCAKGLQKGQTSKASQVLKTRNRRQALTFRNLHRHVPLTLPGTMDGMVTNGTREF